MDPRREAILDAIIREYVETAEPVGSLSLVEKYDFPYSSATVRGEMAELEREGFIHQPHTSAGRVPTEKGYKHFVKLILSESTTLAVRDERKIREKLLGQHIRYEKLLDLAAKTLADSTGCVGIVGVSGLVYSHGLTNLFSQPEFKDSENVEKAAEILDRMHELVEEIPPISNPIVFVGSETPLGMSSGCSMVVSGFETPYGGVGRLAVLGPTRMEYSKVISVVEEIKELLEALGEKYGDQR
jgi:heat-inducible transcriptional repressor